MKTNRSTMKKCPGKILLVVLAAAAGMLGGCWNLSEGYGEPCESNSDCPSLLLQCYDVEREDRKLCLTRAPGPEGQSCVNELECLPGLRCDLASSTCASGGLGLPECDESDCP